VVQALPSAHCRVVWLTLLAKQQAADLLPRCGWVKGAYWDIRDQAVPAAGLDGYPYSHAKEAPIVSYSGVRVAIC